MYVMKIVDSQENKYKIVFINDIYLGEGYEKVN